MIDVTDLPADYVIHIPRPVRALRPHPLGPAITIPAEVSVSGYEQVEKTCKACGAVRVTVLAPGHEHRLWRCRADGPQAEEMPACAGRGPAPAP